MANICPNVLIVDLENSTKQLLTVVPYDLRLYLDYFVNAKKWFIYEFLNRKIQQYAFRGAESRDRPAQVNEQTGKILGHAVQMWHLLRFLPLLIGIKIQDTNDGVW
jgi:hypothetical protein